MIDDKGKLTGSIGWMEAYVVLNNHGWDKNDPDFLPECKGKILPDGRTLKKVIQNGRPIWWMDPAPTWIHNKIGAPNAYKICAQYGIYRNDVVVGSRIHVKDDTYIGRIPNHHCPNGPGVWVLESTKPEAVEIRTVL